MCLSGLHKVKRPLQTIGCSGRLTTVTLPILTRSGPWLSCVRYVYLDVRKEIFRQSFLHHRDAACFLVADAAR